VEVSDLEEGNYFASIRNQPTGIAYSGPSPLLGTRKHSAKRREKQALRGEDLRQGRVFFEKIKRSGDSKIGASAFGRPQIKTREGSTSLQRARDGWDSERG